MRSTAGSCTPMDIFRGFLAVESPAGLTAGVAASIASIFAPTGSLFLKGSGRSGRGSSRSGPSADPPACSVETPVMAATAAQARDTASSTSLQDCRSGDSGSASSACDGVTDWDGNSVGESRARGESPWDEAVAAGTSVTMAAGRGSSNASVDPPSMSPTSLPSSSPALSSSTPSSGARAALQLRLSAVTPALHISGWLSSSSPSVSSLSLSPAAPCGRKPP
mmetsp:Transcript_47996/g.120992  ORF Transcript_47996/g.120992 Transcript_47996/m.120992 type:complete len:222 (+) Transcript_47996:317-982(+)